MTIQSTRVRMKGEQRREEVVHQFLAGATLREIAEKFDVDKSQISRDLKKTREVWAERYSAAIDEQKQQELAKIDFLERTYWAAWEDSKSERIEQTTGKAASGGATASIRRVQRDGDPRYLDGVRWCIEQRCKLYGLYAPTKNEHAGAGGGPIENRIVIEYADTDDAIDAT